MHITRFHLLALLGLLGGCTTKQEPHAASSATLQAAQPDSIGRLVAHLASTHGPYGLMNDGLWTMVDLPVTASTNQVIEQVFQKAGFDKGHVVTCRILETREVLIDSNFSNDSYTAVLAKTGLGRKIVLLRWSTNQQRWWGRFYDE